MKKIMITSALALGVIGGAFLPAAYAGPFNSGSAANLSGSQSTEIRYDHHRRYHRERVYHRRYGRHFDRHHHG